MRLYRGLTKPYRPDLVGAGQGAIYGTDFTDCPIAALRFAKGSRGVVIVLDPPDNHRSLWVTEERWLESGPRRLMIWGRFDEHILAIILAKELRAQIRQRGVARTGDEYKSAILQRFVDEWVAARLRLRSLKYRGPFRAAKARGARKMLVLAVPQDSVEGWRAFSVFFWQAAGIPRSF